MIRTVLVALILVFAWSVQPARAQSFPSKAVKIVVPSAPGDGADIIARTVGQKLSEAWGAKPD